MSANAFSKLEHLVTYYSQGHQGLPCELRQPAMLEDKDVADDDTGKTSGLLVLLAWSVNNYHNNSLHFQAQMWLYSVHTVHVGRDIDS